VADRITNPNGSYTVGGDCRGSASLQKTPFGTANWEFVIVGDGSEVLQIATTPARGALLCYSRSSSRAKSFRPDVACLRISSA
jgi:hypothetical protein